MLSLNFFMTFYNIDPYFIRVSFVQIRVKDD